MDQIVSQEQAAAFVGSLQSLLRELTIGSTDAAIELPLAQLRVCRVLCDGPQSISAISRELGVSLSAVTQLADRLERAKLVRRLAEDTDRRIRCLQLTNRGEMLLRLHDAERIRRMAAALEQLTPKTRGEAAAALDMLVRASVAARSHDGNGEKDGDGKIDGVHILTSKVLL
jgi:DNA-binding MarR family transcriptional regulator